MAKRLLNTILENHDQFTKEAFNSVITSSWRNGSPIDPSKVDDTVYFKVPFNLGGGISKRPIFRGISVLSFGAVGDGITDDTDAFQKALLVAETVLIPANYTFIVSGVRFTFSGQSIVGFGKTSVIKLKSSSWRESVVSDGLDNITIDNVVFDGNYAFNKLSAGSYLNSKNQEVGASDRSGTIRCSGGGNININNVLIINAFATPIVFENCEYSNIFKCYTYNHLKEGFTLIGGIGCCVSRCVSKSDFPLTGFGQPSTFSGVYTRHFLDTDSDHSHSILFNYIENTRLNHINIGTKGSFVSGNVIKKTSELATIAGAGIRLGTYGDILRVATGSHIVANKFNGLDSSLGADELKVAVRIDNADGSTISNNKCINGWLGCLISGTANQFLNIFDNDFKDMRGGGILSTISSAGITKDNVFTNIAKGFALDLLSPDKMSVYGNIFNSVVSGLRIQSPNKTSITNNKVFVFTNKGIEISFTTADDVAGNALMYNEVVGAGTRYTIQRPTEILTESNRDNGVLVSSVILASGVYTPVIIGIANFSSASSISAHYLRIGNEVQVQGSMLILSTVVNTTTILGISLPIASNIGMAIDAVGSSLWVNATTFDNTGKIDGDVANDTARLTYKAATVGNSQEIKFSFTYTIK